MHVVDSSIKDKKRFSICKTDGIDGVMHALFNDCPKEISKTKDADGKKNC